MVKMPHTIDPTGLSVSAAVEVASRDLCRGMTALLLQLAQALTRDGVGRDEINILLERERVEFEAWREESLADLRAWLERDGQSLN
jgi:hypothetical protein